MCPMYATRFIFSSTLHRRTVVSLLALHRYSWPGLKSTANTGLAWPTREAYGRGCPPPPPPLPLSPPPLARSHRRTELSEKPAATRRPSPEATAQFMRPAAWVAVYRHTLGSAAELRLALALRSPRYVASKSSCSPGCGTRPSTSSSPRPLSLGGSSRAFFAAASPASRTARCAASVSAPPCLRASLASAAARAAASLASSSRSSATAASGLSLSTPHRPGRWLVLATSAALAPVTTCSPASSSSGEGWPGDTLTSTFSFTTLSSSISSLRWRYLSSRSKLYWHSVTLTLLASSACAAELPSRWPGEEAPAMALICDAWRRSWSLRKRSMNSRAAAPQSRCTSSRKQCTKTGYRTRLSSFLYMSSEPWTHDTSLPYASMYRSGLVSATLWNCRRGAPLSAPGRRPPAAPAAPAAPPPPGASESSAPRACV
mmetsp:Transcript_13279/g.45946  ORF Transcript_13279/g.45946 Transcript_13279/m.45946 type:complete len:430 (+) Transcript_13279:495-1784(+)